MSRKYLLTFLIGYPGLLLAYIDPGVFAALSQALFVVLAGGIVAFITAPWRAIKSLFTRKNKENHNIDVEMNNNTNEENKVDDKDSLK